MEMPQEIRDMLGSWLAMLDDVWHGNLNKIESNFKNAIQRKYKNEYIMEYGEELLCRLAANYMN